MVQSKYRKKGTTMETGTTIEPGFDRYDEDAWKYPDEPEPGHTGAIVINGVTVAVCEHHDLTKEGE